MQPKITVFESDSASLWFHPEPGIVHHQFRKPLDSETFQKVLLAGLQLMNEHHARKWLSDDRGNSSLSADDSAWSQEFWLPRAVKAGWKYWAMVPPEKARGQLTVQRLTSHVGEESGVTINLFADPERALQWLMEQK
ncbi:MAG TPA: hypothetical protein VK327_01775 [Candidatus Paceibacterota bacterium]|nr:hypothetical protein [Candidatus Paceibacterota bacterium]